MNTSISQELVGFQVSIEMRKMTVKGLVRHIDSTGSKLSLTNAVVLSSDVKLPSLYHIFVKDVINIKKIERSGEVMEEASVDPTVKTRSLMKPSNYVPSHLKHMDNNINTDILVNKVAQEVPPEVKISLPEYSIIDSLDSSYYEAVEHILKEKAVGIGMEGVRISRTGLVCWISVATTSHVYLFDMLCLGKVGMKSGLNQLYTNPEIMKVVHDCRFLADALVHQYGIYMVNVFDTQVAAATIAYYRTKAFNKYVSSLTFCLTKYLNFARESLFHPRVRQGHEKEDESRWKQRPLPEHLVEGAVQNVCHLRKLRGVLIDKLLWTVNKGTSFYLREVSQLPDDEVPDKLLNTHLIPVRFNTFHTPQTADNSGGTADAESKSNRGFSNDVDRSIDPYVNFTRHTPRTYKKIP